MCSRHLMVRWRSTSRRDDARHLLIISCHRSSGLELRRGGALGAPPLLTPVSRGVRAWRKPGARPAETARHATRAARDTPLSPALVSRAPATTPRGARSRRLVSAQPLGRTLLTISTPQRQRGHGRRRAGAFFDSSNDAANSSASVNRRANVQIEGSKSQHARLHVYELAQSRTAQGACARRRCSEARVGAACTSTQTLQITDHPQPTPHLQHTHTHTPFQGRTVSSK